MVVAERVIWNNTLCLHKHSVVGESQTQDETHLLAQMLDVLCRGMGSPETFRCVRFRNLQRQCSTGFVTKHLLFQGQVVVANSKRWFMLCGALTA